MDLIEQLGGYEKAKNFLNESNGKDWNGVFYMPKLKQSLLEYRRQHKIYEVDDLVYGVGVNDRSRPAYSNSKVTKEYDHWVGMLERCYGKNKNIKSRPTYKSCECSDGFKSYSYFYDWCQSQAGFNEDKWHLDKDILVDGNKFYSEDTCVFIPCAINNFIANKRVNNKSGYTGVSFHKASGKYAVQISIGGKRKHLGLFEDPREGENFYLLMKRRVAIELIEKYKSNLDERVVDVLLSKYKPEEIEAGYRLPEKDKDV